MAAVVVACCENDIQIPCLVFSTLDKAKGFLNGVFGGSRKGKYGLGSRRKRATASVFFKLHYDGCGGVEYYIALEVQEGEPIVAFDLE